MKTIPLSQGKFAMVDDEEYELLSKYKWHYSRGDGAVRHMGKIDGVRWQERKTEYMHRRIMGCPDGMVVDHINHDRLDNRKHNLRICTNAQNLMNKVKHKGISKYKGVSPSRNRKKWNAFVGINYKSLYIGMFPTEESAAWAYDSCARILHKEFACTNFDEPTIKDMEQAYIIAGANDPIQAAVQMRQRILLEARKEVTDESVKEVFPS